MDDYFRGGFDYPPDMSEKYKILTREVAEKFFGGDRFFKWLFDKGHTDVKWTLDLIEYRHVTTLQPKETPDEPWVLLNYLNDNFCKLMNGQELRCKDNIEGSMMFEYYKYLRSIDPTFPTLKVSAGRAFSNYLVLIIVPEVEVKIIDMIKDKSKTLKDKEFEIEQFIRANLHNYTPTRPVLMAMYEAKFTADMIFTTASLGQLRLCSPDIKTMPPRREQHHAYQMSDVEVCNEKFRQKIEVMYEYESKYVPFWGRPYPEKKEKERRPCHDPPVYRPTADHIKLMKFRPTFDQCRDKECNKKELQAVIHTIKCDLETLGFDV